MNLVVALAAAVACWLLVGPPPVARLREPAPVAVAGQVRWRRWLPPGLAIAAAVGVGAVLGGGSGAVVGFAIALPLATAGQVWRHHHRRASAADAARRVLSACQLLAGLLRVGHVPATALAAAARDAPLLGEAAAVVAVGGPAGPVLRRLGSIPGQGGLVELGVAWEVAERTGASLTATLDALVDRLAARQSVQNVVAAELAAPRATGRLLAALPVVGVVLGYSFGGDPIGFLTASLPGQFSLAAGVLLGCAGVVWTERIAEAGGG